MDAFLYKYGLGQGINERKKWFMKEGRLAQTAVSMPWAEEGEPLILCPDKERNTVEPYSTFLLDGPCWLFWQMLISIEDMQR